MLAPTITLGGFFWGSGQGSPGCCQLQSGPSLPWAALTGMLTGGRGHPLCNLLEGGRWSTRRGGRSDREAAGLWGPPCRWGSLPSPGGSASAPSPLMRLGCDVERPEAGVTCSRLPTVSLGRAACPSEPRLQGLRGRAPGEPTLHPRHGHLSGSLLSAGLTVFTPPGMRAAVFPDGSRVLRRELPAWACVLSGSLLPHRPREEPRMDSQLQCSTV